MGENFAAISAVLLVVAILFWWLRSSKANWSAEEVASLLQSMLNGRLDDRNWDNFISVEQSDPKLEAIRQQVLAIWVDDSDYMDEDQIDPCRLNALGRQKVTELLKECGRLEREALNT